jgi:hypothetical protein
MHPSKGHDKLTAWAGSSYIEGHGFFLDDVGNVVYYAVWSDPLASHLYFHVPWHLTIICDHRQNQLVVGMFPLSLSMEWVMSWHEYSLIPSCFNPFLLHALA